MYIGEVQLLVMRVRRHVDYGCDDPLLFWERYSAHVVVPAGDFSVADRAAQERE